MQRILLAVLIVGLCALGAGRPARAQGHGAATPEEAVTILVSGGTPQGPVRSDCSLGTRTYQGCPITDRLLQRLEQASLAAFGEPVSRGSGQDLSPRIRITEVANTGGVALVNAAFEGGVGAVTITFEVRGQGRQWLVDNSYCAGKPATTIYAGPTPIAPCGVSPAPLPATAGASAATDAWLPALLGILAAGVGLIVRRRAQAPR